MYKNYNNRYFINLGLIKKRRKKISNCQISILFPRKIFPHARIKIGNNSPPIFAPFESISGFLMDFYWVG